MPAEQRTQYVNHPHAVSLLAHDQTDELPRGGLVQRDLPAARQIGDEIAWSQAAAAPQLGTCQLAFQRLFVPAASGVP